ncbi:hypothetical protein ZIOFF_012311 [Zingiber officinale]|uniref:CCT domain-containing protein n=1 Tax=Zingiber officinale TaxID=94328 RepID=A0A8J5LQM8_ZINOF|nr:hypothetical protein ZIOFF_012311 [Zingiber officinale]
MLHSHAWRWTRILNFGAFQFRHTVDPNQASTDIENPFPSCPTSTAAENVKLKTRDRIAAQPNLLHYLPGYEVSYPSVLELNQLSLFMSEKAAGVYHVGLAMAPSSLFAVGTAVQCQWDAADSRGPRSASFLVHKSSSLLGAKHLNAMFLSSSSYGGLRHQPFISSASDPPPEHFHEALYGRLFPFSSTFFAAQYSDLHRSGCSLSLPLHHHYYYHHDTTSGDLQDQPPPPPYSSSPSSVLSTGDLQGTQYGSLEGSAGDPGRVRRYSAEERKERIDRYRSKRNQRNFQKKITVRIPILLNFNRPIDRLIGIPSSTRAERRSPTAGRGCGADSRRTATRRRWQIWRLSTATWARG